jgi:small nuclear ribonucleoprotein (snRNP)-like protein
MIQNKIVVRYQNGKILKGQTSDFLPAKPTFHVSVFGASSGSQSQEIKVADLKAIFFVRDFKGDREYEEAKDFSAIKPAGRKIQVIFKDGETLVGTTQGYDPHRQGFFVIPADGKSNNERSFIVASATNKISFI